jgi:hypothetical protein
LLLLQLPRGPPVLLHAWLTLQLLQGLLLLLLLLLLRGWPPQ